MAFLDLVGELTGVLPGLAPQLAEKYINRALDDIYGERLWSFLSGDGALVVPAAITTGAASITQFSSTVTLNATASAAIAGQIAGGAVPGLQALQIRFSTTNATFTGGIYSIVDFDDTNPAAVILTLDRVVQEATTAAASYQIYRPLITPPSSDFLKWESVVDPTNTITITGNKLTVPVSRIDQMDPQRTSAGLAYYLASWGSNRSTSSGNVPYALGNSSTPIYELWPGPTTGQVFYARYRRKGAPFVEPDDVQPDLISDAIIMDRALAWHAYPFAMANVANFPSFKGVNWPLLLTTKKADYNRALLELKRNDDERQLSSILSRGYTARGRRVFGFGEPGYPIDANFLQSHLVRF